MHSNTGFQPFYQNLFSYKRFLTREVHVGNLPMGGTNPIRIQTMTNTNTMDTLATVEQCISCIKVGADYVRITAPGIAEAENLANIKNELNKQGFFNPLVADIHFNPKAAEVAAAIVEKVRINPGNYIDKKHSANNDFTDKEYSLELERVRERLLPLLNICKQHNTAIRIGVNHGSLSDRIMSRYGDTPYGMVESAMEFLRICAAENFHQLVVSLKASNTRVMVQANRLLVSQMVAEQMNYPLHLGVTEAGDGEDGRIKSAVGISSLLTDGIGDTIRVSLSEDPEAEIPVAKAIVSYFDNRTETFPIQPSSFAFFKPFTFKKRESNYIENIGGRHVPVVISDWENNETKTGYINPDYYYLLKGSKINDLPDSNKYIQNFKEWIVTSVGKQNIFPLYTNSEFQFYQQRSPVLNFVIAESRDFSDTFYKVLSDSRNTVIILESFNKNSIADQRSIFASLIERKILIPIIINRNYAEELPVAFQLKSASDLGVLLLDGMGDGIWLRNANNLNENCVLTTSFGILQASRVRTTKTEYISCPSCGRTLFNIQMTIAKVKEKTSHLKHLKIAIMGCIVNGPGEMADADYGYVGAGPGKITLYKGKEVIKKSIPNEQAVDELINVIKANGDWIEEKS